MSDAPAESTHAFATFDGQSLVYRAWLPAEPTSKAVILLHRGHEHSGRWRGTVERLGLTDAAVFAWDQRGHGDSPGERGDAPSLAAVVRDLDCWAKVLVARHGVDLRDAVLVAHSVGGVIGAAWVHDYAPPLRGLVLATPAFRVKLYVPGAIPALRLRRKLTGGGYVKSYVKARVLTHDPEQREAYRRDDKIFRQISVRMLLDLHDAGTRLVADAGAILTPTLVLAAGRDWVVKRSAQRRFYERLSSAAKEMEVYPQAYHALFHETIRGEVVDRVRRFIGECFARPRQAAAEQSLLAADRGGFTRTEFDRLRQPGGLRWAAVRRAMGVAGKLSDGIGLGRRQGFDSGVMLDYVYENRASGRTPLGRVIDRNYLNSPGWRGIRARRENLQRLLREAIATLRREGKPVRVLDVAAGAGRYVLETVAAVEGATAVLRDYKQANLDAARAAVERMHLADRVTVEHGDAFDRASITATEPRPTVGIVSGLFELIPENGPVRQTLAGLAEAIEPGGFLIYTTQPWHPQIEFIARALTNREGEPWVMRRRSQAEMDALAREAGFEKIEQAIDDAGIFTVALARRM